MRRVLAALTLLTASVAAALVASSGATGVQPTFSITLNPTTPDTGTPLGFSGHCSNADAIGKPIHVLMFNVVEVSTMGEVDPVIDASGDFSGSFPAGWAPVAGWYQVVATCPLQSVNDGYQASPIIDATMELTPQAMTVSTGPGDADKPLQIVVDVAGASCDGKAVNWTVLDGSLNELASGVADPDTDGTWSSHAVTTLSSLPADDVRTAYAMCVGGETVLALYSGTNEVAPPVTDPTSSTTSTPEAPSTTVAGAPATVATPVAADPTYTG
jgi:hypothetical protein